MRSFNTLQGMMDFLEEHPKQPLEIRLKFLSKGEWRGSIELGGHTGVEFPLRSSEACVQALKYIKKQIENKRPKMNGR